MTNTKDVLQQLKSHHQNLLMHHIDYLTALRQTNSEIKDRRDVPQDIKNTLKEIENHQERTVNGSRQIVQKLEDMIPWKHSNNNSNKNTTT